MNEILEPGMWVRHPRALEWAVGQVQSRTGNRVVVNFAEAGKQVVEGSRVQLQLVVGETDMDLDLNSTPAGVKHP